MGLPAGVPQGQPFKKMPAPFQRPSVTLSTSSSEKHDWRFVRPSFLAVGDIVVDHGVVVATSEEFDFESHTLYVLLEVGVPESHILKVSDSFLLYAFTRKG